MSSQLSLLEGLARQARGIHAAEGRCWGFVERVRERARQVALERGEVSADDLRPWARARGITPPHPNAWGAVFKAPGFRAIGRRRSRWITNNARWITVWTWSPLT